MHNTIKDLQDLAYNPIKRLVLQTKDKQHDQRHV